MKSKNLVFGVFFYCIFLMQFSLYGQHDYLRFKRLTINDGLSLSSVYTIFQDSKGFMWFGTEDGLNKYDGKRFKIYRPDPGNTNSLSYKWTELIYEDTNGHFWLGSKGGLSRFDPVTENFKQYGSQKEKATLTGDTVTCAVESKRNDLWVGTTSGINRISLGSSLVEFTGLQSVQINTIRVFSDEVWAGTNKGIFVKKANDNSFHQVAVGGEDSVKQIVYSIVEDENQHIWAGVGPTLYRLNRLEKESQWECVISPDDLGSQMDQIEKLIFDDHQTIWMSCSNGLYQFDQKEKKLASFLRSIDSSHSLAINPLKSIHKDSSGKLWYGTFGEGIYRIDLKTGRFNNFRNNPGDLQSISQNAINCITEDRSGNIWFGTFGAGINVFQPEAHKFGFISHQPLNTNSLSSNFIWSIMECDNGLVWIGTNDAGLNKYDPMTDNYQVFLHSPDDPYSISHSSVRKVYQDSKKRIWIGTDGGGLNRFFPETGRFIHYKNIPDDATSISGNSVRVIYEDNEQRLWIGTRSGLNLFDPEKATFQRFVHTEQDVNSISNDFIYSSILHDTKGNLWIGTYGGGLNKMDIKSGKFQHYLNNPAETESISDNIVFSIYEDRSGILWVGTNSGLNRFDPRNEKFQRFGIREGLPNEVIYGILPQDSSTLWLSTNKGICRFDIADYSTKNFNTSDGLQSNEFNGGAFHKGKSGMMYFGGVYGLNIIDPELSYIKENTSQVVFTRLEVFGNEVKTISDTSSTNIENRINKIGKQYFLPKDISYSHEIFLDYQDRFISIEYAALNSANTSNLMFQYIMEGLDNNWNDVGNRNYITFANLQPGDYNLKIRSINHDGYYSDSNAEITVVIIPPFWKTRWFYLFEVLVFLVLLTFIYKYLLKIRTNRLLRVQNEKIFLANQKLKESEKNLKQLNATKDKFFSIISHDLKNPFTSLLSISELMSNDYKNLDEEDKEQGVKSIYDSAWRIYKLLENLLTWARSQSGRVKFEPVNFELDSIIEDNVMLHCELANKKDIEMETRYPDNVSAFGDPEMISTVVRNLLSNAIKFSPRGESISIQIKDLKSIWIVSVIDQGVGIAPENQEKIFKIDTKFKTEGTSGEKGTGLGLLICKEFVEKNGGKIKISSKEGKGSSFSFSLPKSGKFVQ